MITELRSKISSLLPQYEDRVTVLATKPDFGDYTTNIAMEIARDVKKPPLELAEEIAQKIRDAHWYSQLLSDVQVSAPGYINMKLADTYIIKAVGERVEQKKGTILIEYTDPNPFKEFHIGHLFSNIVGESIARLHEIMGYEVKRLCYQGDVGMHVAKTLYGMLHEENLDETLEALETTSLSQRAQALGKWYAAGAGAFEESEKAKVEITELNKKIYEGDAGIMRYYSVGRAWSLAYFETIYSRLGTRFNQYFFESESAQYGKQLVEKHPELFTHSKGAVVFEGEKYGLHTRVFINSQGFPTYEAKDLGLAHLKDRTFTQYAQSYVITGNEVNTYFHVMLKALSLISPDIAKKTTHVGHGIVKLPSGKMSSRTGSIVSGESLLEAVEKKVSSPVLAVAAIKYALLKQHYGSDIIFDTEKSVSVQGDSGIYLMYAYVRSRKICENNKGTALKITNPDERALILKLAQFSDVISLSFERLEPHHIAVYLNQLAAQFHAFYSVHRIAGNGARVRITEKVAEVLKEGMDLLGISVVDEM